jgi:hypothetical protein
MKKMLKKILENKMSFINYPNENFAKLFIFDVKYNGRGITHRIA